MIEEGIKKRKLLMPKVAFFCCYLPLKEFAVKLKLGLLFNFLKIFSFLIVCWLILSFVDEWDNRYKSIKIFLYKSTIDLENKEKEEAIT